MAGKWNESEKTELSKVLSVMATIQKNYGRDFDIKKTIAAWEFILHDCTPSQVAAAAAQYMRQSSDIPAPADLLKIINPPEPQITYAEYVHALKQHEAAGYPAFGSYGQVIKDYHRQNEIPERKTYYQILEERQNSTLKIGKTIND